jgi:hypothetical protein
VNHDLMSAARPLDKGKLVRVHDGRGLRVLCLSGSLWVTQDNDPRDVVLEPGGSFEIDRDGDTLLSALNNVRFVLLQQV